MFGKSFTWSVFARLAALRFGFRSHTLTAGVCV
ncbi:unnamed protein product [Wuchereria bancrofti]|uniref:Uncharacterized protein n=1 Tax=Wuchereria bancrofti TaxID=6293 RepID=A0A3P7E1I8_WUCBA|nr:unnamed protein product [Wuchereria bancrofti]